MSGLDTNNSILCVWSATGVGEASAADFGQWLSDGFNVRGRWIEDIHTLPDHVEGVEVAGTGGRIDAFFWVHHEDIPKFAVPRLELGVRWYSDYIDSDRAIVPDEIIEKYKGQEGRKS